jgi:hypothetical protein
MLKRTLFTASVLAICGLSFLVLPGCPRSPCGPLEEGKAYEVELAIGGDGTFYAIEAETTGASFDVGQGRLTAKVTDVAADRTTFELLGALTVALEPGAAGGSMIETISVGDWVRVEGAVAQDGVFQADVLADAGEHETELEAVLESLTDASFTMIGLTIAYDDATETECEEEEEDDDDDDDDDDDEEDDD